MNRIPSVLKSLVLACVLGLPFAPSAQTNPADELYLQIHHLDSLLFERGFNACELDVVRNLVSEDFEFYHDQNGVQDKALFLKGFEESLCANPDRKPIRKLTEGSMEVFPLFNEGKLYGAIQTGTHEFYIREPNKPLYQTNVALFTQVWMLEDGIWRLKRVLSFDHKEP